MRSVHAQPCLVSLLFGFALLVALAMPPAADSAMSGVLSDIVLSFSGPISTSMESGDVTGEVHVTSFTTSKRT